jgi:glutathione peroxidase
MAWIGLAGGVGLLSAAAWAGGVVQKTEDKSAGHKEGQSVYDFVVKDIDGKDVPLAKYKGDVLLIVNVASLCGLTKDHYAKLEPLYQKYRDQGFKILAFPANNFGKQEPGSDREIKETCTNTYHLTFDLFSKISVKGEDQAPLYKYLTNHPDKDIAGPVEWNFQKYLVDRKGSVIAKFNPKVTPDAAPVIERIEKVLAEPRS